MEKKKMAKALALTAALAGGIAAAQSFFNEAHASEPRSCYNFEAEWIAHGGSGSYVCRKAGDNCRYVPG